MQQVIQAGSQIARPTNVQTVRPSDPVNILSLQNDNTLKGNVYICMETAAIILINFCLAICASKYHYHANTSNAFTFPSFFLHANARKVCFV